MKITITEKEYNAGKNTLINFLSSLIVLERTINDDEKMDIVSKMNEIKRFDDCLNKTVTINNKSVDILIDKGINIDIDDELVSDMLSTVCNPTIMSIMYTINDIVRSLKLIVTVTLLPAIESFKNKFLKDIKIVVSDKKMKKENETGFKIPNEDVE